jgi:hypothetical protein
VDLDGGVLPITVSADKSQRFVVKQAAAVLSMGRIERRLNEQLFDAYNLDMKVHCGGPRVRVVSVGTLMHCDVTGPLSRKSQLAFKVRDVDANLSLEPLRGVRRADAPYLQRYVEAHEKGDATIVPGGLVERYISDELHKKFAGSADLRDLGRIACPSHLDLTRSKRGECTLTLAHQVMHEDVWIPKGRFAFAPREATLPIAKVTSTATAYYDSRIRAAGGSDFTHVDCGGRRIVVLLPGSSFDCALRVAKRSFILKVTATDTAGTFSLDLRRP